MSRLAIGLARKNSLPRRGVRLFGALLILAQPFTVVAAVVATPIHFNLDIQPILSEYCFACHGPDSSQRKSGLRLDQRADALRRAKSGHPAIVPGKVAESRLIQRIHSGDADDVMPPPESRKQLTAVQKDLLRRWIAEGANYEAHWAFVPPHRPELPPVKLQRWPRNAVDRFILARLEAEHLQPSPEADRATLIRRVSLDLTGLPPTPQEVDAFVADRSPGAYERVVDRLLRSEHYGERMAVDWLDAARFADSNGYQVDRDREMYAWRDWAIRAFNINQPFDAFTVEQIAGDLLPNPTFDQRIATGFHRNHMVNEEGGIIPEEFLAEYCADRVETTATVWLGQTFNCARCHDHKFDPFTQRDFYGLFAFFHNVTEKGIGDYSANIRRNNPPMVQLPTPELEAKRAGLKQEQVGTQAELEKVKASLMATQPEWEQQILHAPVSWSPARVLAATLDTNAVSPPQTVDRITLPAMAKGRHALALEFALPISNPTALRIEFTASAVSASASTNTNEKALVPLTELSLSPLVSARARPEQAREVNHANGTNATNASSLPWPLRAAELPGTLPATDAALALDAKGKKSTRVLLSPGAPATVLYELDPRGESESNRCRLQWTVPAEEPLPVVEIALAFTGSPADMLVPEKTRSLIAKESGQRTAEEMKQLVEFRMAKSPEHRTLSSRLTTLARQIDEVDLQIPTALVMEEMPAQRPTHVLLRGAYDKQGDVVMPRTPESLPPMSESWPRNRLGLARWLTDPSNPLPARVTVNRFWQSVFGTGLVRTAEDFGVKGEPPSHPELLDWLATEFVESGWNVKAMMRLLVTSATYRQSSKLTRQLRERDPQNRLLARSPRYRLQAEFVRDQALATSGLLVRKIGGPSVRPYHPPGLYEQVVAGSGPSTYVVGQGEDLHRRSLYTYWKRSVPNPAMLLFDAPFREACAVRRPRTNTPLQALNLMNDPTYVEAARALAERALREAGDQAEARLSWAFRLVTARRPRAAELAVLQSALARSLQQFAADLPAAEQLLKVGTTVADPSLNAVELAAYTTVASTLLNLDEVVTRE